MTRVAVIGCGAIGSLLAAHLARVPDVEVWAIDPAESHVAAIRELGLQVSGLADFSVTLEARTDAREVPPCELAIVATKSLVTRDAIRGAAAVVQDAAVASVQNGVGNEELIAEVAPRVLLGSTLIAGSLAGPGHVHYDAPGGIWIGPFPDRPASLQEADLLADLLSRGGLDATALADARGPQWTKLLFNAATNAVGALTGLTIGEVGTSLALAPLVETLVAEGETVASALGVTVESDPRAMLDEAVRIAFGHRTSMLQDVAARRLTEVDWLNGGIVRAGRAAGVPTPGHEAMVALVHALEESWRR